MTKAVLDGNIYDYLARDKQFREYLAKLVETGLLRVLVPRTVAKELHSSHFCGVPDFFPVEYISDAVARSGLLRTGNRLGEGQIYQAHLGNSKKINDALIVDAADCNAKWLVSEDKRLRTRMAKVGQNCSSLSYMEFIERIKTLAF